MDLSQSSIFSKTYIIYFQDRKMALVQLANVEDAIAGLVKLHNYQLSETSHLRVSFSKSTI